MKWRLWGPGAQFGYGAAGSTFCLAFGRKAMLPIMQDGVILLQVPLHQVRFQLGGRLGEVLVQ
jgi:hypothetical protein